MDPRVDFSEEKSNQMLTTAVKVYLNGDEVVALWDTGSRGMGVGVSLIEENMCSLFYRKVVGALRPICDHLCLWSDKH